MGGEREEKNMMILQQDKHIHKNYLCDVRERREAEGGKIISDCSRTLQGGTYTSLPHLVCVSGGKVLKASFSLIPRPLGRPGNEAPPRASLALVFCSRKEYGGEKPSHVSDFGVDTRESEGS